MRRCPRPCSCCSDRRHGGPLGAARRRRGERAGRSRVRARTPARAGAIAHAPAYAGTHAAARGASLACPFAVRACHGAEGKGTGGRPGGMRRPIVARPLMIAAAFRRRRRPVGRTRAARTAGRLRGVRRGRAAATVRLQHPCGEILRAWAGGTATTTATTSESSTLGCCHEATRT